MASEAAKSVAAMWQRIKPSTSALSEGSVSTIALVASAAATTGCIVLFCKRRAVYCTVVRLVCGSRGGPRPGSQYLEGNYAPVAGEVYDDELTVESGSLPSDLCGVYLRNGPNPLLKPLYGYHWFDGDGMLHGVRIKGGKASYANHAVRTSRLQQELALKLPIFTKLGDMAGWRGLLVLQLQRLAVKLGLYRVDEGAGTANTAVVYFARRIMALHEGDLPYVVRVLCSGVMETLGRMRPLTLNGFKGPFTAHPKIDPITGEMFFLGYSMGSLPYCTVGKLDAHGKLEGTWDIDLPYPTMMHDMGLTANYVVLLHLPLCVDGESMLKEDELLLKFREDRPARIGLFPRSTPVGAKAEVQWFEFSSFMSFHIANAHEEEDGRVKVYSCHYKTFSFAFMRQSTAPPESQRARIYEYTLDPACGQGAIKMISSVSGDFPVVHPCCASRKARYAWVATMDTREGVTTPDFVGVAKIDLQAGSKKGDACVGVITFPEGCTGGEAFFVPKGYKGLPAELAQMSGELRESSSPAKAKPASPSKPPALPSSHEDDGYLLVYVHYPGPDGGCSKLHVYDARHMAQKPLAVVGLPRRVPNGFHSTWVTEQQLARQLTWQL